MFTSHRKLKPQYNKNIRIDCTDIPQVSSVKFLGVYIDQHLTWTVHIKQITSKIGKNIGIIARIAHILPTKIILYTIP